MIVRLNDTVYQSKSTVIFKIRFSKRIKAPQIRQGRGPRLVQRAEVPFLLLILFKRVGNISQLRI